jgi:hypothetical protein
MQGMQGIREREERETEEEEEEETKTETEEALAGINADEHR